MMKSLALVVVVVAAVANGMVVIKPAVAKVVKSGGAIECEICKVLYTVAAQYINQEEPTIQKYADEACDALGPFADTCKQYVNQYLPQIVAAIKSGSSEDEVCTNLLGLCSSKANSMILKPVVAKVVKSGGAIECEICKVLYTVAAQYINEEEPTIQKYADEACDALGPFADTCKTYVNQYLPQIVAAIKSGSSEDEVCTDLLGLCSSKAALPIQNGNIIECEICKLIVKLLAEAVADHNTAILNDLAKVCDVFPSSWKSKCVEIVNQYGAEVIKMIEDGAADKACDVIGTSAKLTKSFC